MAFRRIGLTGNIGSGKSEVSRVLGRYGVSIINLDDLGRRISNEPGSATEIARLLGPGVFVDGKLERARVRELIFSSAEKREALEKFLHPLIWKAFESECEKLQSNGQSLVICEAALLYESGLDKELDAMIVVSANEKSRRERLTVRDGLSSEQFDSISRIQGNESEKLKRATYIIDNSGPVEALRPQVLSLVNRWRAEGTIP